MASGMSFFRPGMNWQETVILRVRATEVIRFRMVAACPGFCLPFINLVKCRYIVSHNLDVASTVMRGPGGNGFFHCGKLLDINMCIG